MFVISAASCVQVRGLVPVYTCWDLVNSTRSRRMIVVRQRQPVSCVPLRVWNVRSPGRSRRRWSADYTVSKNVVGCSRLICLNCTSSRTSGRWNTSELLWDSSNPLAIELNYIVLNWYRFTTYPPFASPQQVYSSGALEEPPHILPFLLFIPIILPKSGPESFHISFPDWFSSN
jgi:hypothetical protein